MALPSVLAKLLPFTRQATAPSIVREAFAILTQRFTTVEVALTKHSTCLGDQIATKPVLGLPSAGQNASASISQPHPAPIPFPSISSSVFLFRSVKTSARTTSKTPKPQKAALASGLPSGKPPNQVVNQSISSKLAENLSRARSQAAPATLASSAASPEFSSGGARATTSVHEAGGPGGEASQPQFSGSEEERKGSKVVRVLAIMVLGYIGWNIYPLMGESMVTHAVALTRSKDPFLQRSGASRVAMIATTEKRRRKVVELGGVASLARIVRNESVDDVTLEQVLDSLVKICEGPEAIAALREADLNTTLQRVMASRTESGLLDKASVLLERSIETELAI
ncbi:ARM repeat superfamily protein [Klebsormidium nitens]|uniref:ARM repeat superfamily protein n=1 Tax=Klebsormidium nitens TaxID=105231 RepID=A0A1Y1IJM8_KLENI|nr:ARM repeat superfamily protein [Klebsormidium nitens]|eukprot:GAQ88827.1 ARM repeat superfamily protein [Klebsormidium nitens]